jgi:hypothetical protein
MCQPNARKLMHGVIKPVTYRTDDSRLHTSRIILQYIDIWYKIDSWVWQQDNIELVM